MKLRWKLMWLLVGVAVLPLVVMRGFEVRALSGLSREVRDDSVAALRAAAEAEMRAAVAGYGQTIAEEGRAVELLLERQRAAVEARLRGLNEPAGEVRLWEPRDFVLRGVGGAGGEREAEPGGGDPQALGGEAGGVGGAGRVPGLERLVIPEGGVPPRADPIGVSYLHHVTYRAPGVDEAVAGGQAAALADMTTEFVAVRERVPRPPLWQYVTLGSGLHVSYPGKGAGYGLAAAEAGEGEAYDPREREWYVLTEVGEGGGQGVQWYVPSVDFTTGTLLFTAALPVRDEAGAKIGVTAVDVPVSQILNQQRLATPWAGSARIVGLYLASAEEGVLAGLAGGGMTGEGLGLTPYVLYDTSGMIDRARLDDPVRRDFSSIVDDAEREALVAELRETGRGVLEVTVGGVRTLVAFGRMSTDLERPSFVLVMVPLEALLEPANALAGRIDAALWEQLATTGVVVVAMVLLVGVLAWWSARTVTRPVQRLAEAAERLAGGDLETRVEDTKRNDELGSLERLFNQMTPRLRDRVRLKGALQVAMEVQQSLLPGRPPELEGVQLSGGSWYCDETGGDYYDFLELEQVGDGRVGVAIGDVTGHGIAAALLMATARALLRARIGHPGSLAEVFADVNRELTGPGFSGRFMTLFYLLLELGGGGGGGRLGLRFVSAGHDPALVYDPATDTFSELEGTDVPLGIEAGWAFKEHVAEAPPAGSVMFMGTDGIWEAFNSADELYGKDRLKAAIRRHAGLDADGLAEAIRRDVDAFRGGCEQKDDITMVVVKFVA
ncbi:MAG: SpoIIE family protein phosphatase [Planctomycetota bacterium]